MKNKSKNQLIQELTEALRKETLAKKILDLTVDGFCFIDKTGNIIEVNSAFCKITGYSHEELLTMNMLNLTRKGSLKKMLDAVKNIKKYGTQHFEYFLKRKNGQIISVESSINFLNEKNKNEVFIFMRDITSRKTLEKKIIEQKNELERKNIALKEVLAQIEIEKEQLKKNIASNIDELILPSLQKVRTKSPKNCAQKIKLIETDLKNISSSFSYKLAGACFKLTPKEMEICNMIKNGLGSKEMAALLNTSLRTIENHRQHIRKKLKISNQKINLTTFLQNF